jgi:hypothetical protein
VGLYRPVHVKTLRSQKLRMLPILVDGTDGQYTIFGCPIVK